MSALSLRRSDLLTSLLYPDDVVVDIPTLLQASYALGLLFICPCGDLVRRRPMLLLLIFVAGILTLYVCLAPYTLETLNSL